MKAGDLRHRITLEYPKRTPDSYSSEDIVWTTSATVWAAVWPVSAREVIDNMKSEMEVTHRFRIRYRSNVTGEMRIKFKLKYYNIVEVINKDERNIYLDILATDRV